MYTSFNIAWNVVYILLGVNILLTLIVYGVKWRNIKKEKAIKRFSDKYGDYLAYIQANMESEERLRVPSGKLKRTEYAVLQERLDDMIESITGSDRQKLVQLCVDLGLVSYHLKRLNSGAYRKKLDAAYHLGCMRVQEAVPALLSFLRQHPFDSSLFVIARAIAKCAKEKREIKEMVQILLQHQRNFHPLLVDIIKESALDHSALFSEFIKAKNADLVKLGLIGLKDYNEPTAASAVYQWINAADEEIQVNAVDVYLKSSHLLPRNIVDRLMNHQNPEIRLLTAEALGHLTSEAYVGILQEGLTDVDGQVVYASAKSLLNYGQEGISVLCRAASEARGNEHGEWIHTIIQEEMNRLAEQVHDVQKLAQYNLFVFTYAKFFGKNEAYNRVVV